MAIWLFFSLINIRKHRSLAHKKTTAVAMVFIDLGFI